MYKQIINEICHELNIKVTFLSKDWIIMLESNGITKYLAGYKFDLNHHASGLVVDDKYAMYEVLKNHHIPVIEHQIMYDENNSEEYAKDSKDRQIIADYFTNHQNNIVLKANTGTCGNEVYHITNKDDLTTTLNKMFAKNHSISLCPFYDITCEYRTIILNDEVLLVYGKIRPIIIGDGHHKISELLHKFNPSFHYKITNDFILDKGVKYCYSWKHNLSSGAIVTFNIQERDLISTLAKQAATALNLKFGSVDIIKTNNEYLVLECNSGVMMSNLVNLIPNGHQLVKDIYKKALIELFNEQKK